MWFPADFAFVVTVEELAVLRSQIVTSSSSGIRTQIATASKHGGLRYLPRAFTEHGAIMAASVLNSPRAVAMSVFVVRAFVNMRRMIVDQRGLARKLSELERTLTAQLNVHETGITEVLQRIMRLLNPPDKPKPPRKQIGFHVQEPGTKYLRETGNAGPTSRLKRRNNP